uniref:Hemoglobin subunit alpha n=1 Tax=Lepidosiren paradoxus TaxID=7883 RepID=HBA_LEPPA|nr:RecName: Full=Hemoglobin subunit alpha; AltName: Full=Alpha-globin; AltName: Full=Hemoglobin alpha chain [Lepidosiren paradoxa]
MRFSQDDEVLIKEAWGLLHQIPNAGGEALARMFSCYPGTKSYFPHFGHDFSANNEKVKHHGKKVVDAIGQGVQHLHDLSSCLHTLSEKHARELMVDPCNFQYLIEAIMTTIAAHYGEKFTPEINCAAEKCLGQIVHVLISLYR